MISIVPNPPSTTKRHDRHLSSTPENAWLRFDRNVSRDLVHRTALAEVLIADTVQVADDEFLLGTQLPRAHSLWSDRRYSYHDPLLTIEVCRQACIAIPQRYYDVGPDWQFISRQIDLRVVNLDAFADTEISPPEAILRARFSNKRERHGVLSGLTVESELTIEETSAATVHGDLMFFPKTTFERLRSQRRKDHPLDRTQPQRIPQPFDPVRVGRSLDRNVTIGESAIPALAAGERRYAAIVDQKHPCFFDHPLDHLPGALVIEVYRQAAIAAATCNGEASPAAAVVTRCEVHLSDFAELDAAIECSATIIDEPADGPVQIALALHQFDSQIGDAHVELGFASVGHHR
jgi:A-factor biosynthesis hotdog domain